MNAALAKANLSLEGLYVSPAMMKTYSHVRRKALDAAAAVLEPTSVAEASTEAEKSSEESEPKDEQVTSHGTSQSLTADDQKREIAKENGSSGWTRTSNPPVNSRMLCH